MDSSPKPTKKDIQDALHRIQPFVHKTPVVQCHSLNRILDCSIYLKCENLQKVGAFKARGAANKLSQLKDTKGVCTHSSGNHGQALAYVSSLLKIPCYVVMPENSPLVKKNAVAEYGALVVQSGNTQVDRQKMVEKVIQDHKVDFVHPYNDIQIITGQGTAAYEFYLQLNQKNVELDYIVFPIGGGGLASGTILASKYLSPQTKRIGVEPELAKDAYLSLQQGSIHPQLPPKSVADGLRTSLGSFTFPIIRDYIDQILLVSQKQIIEATQMLMERTKMVIEPSSATVIAAIRKDIRFRGKRVGAIISGGNVDFSEFFTSLNIKFP